MIYAIALIILAALGPAKSPEAAPSCDASPALRALFTPKRPIAGRYDACTARASIDTLAARTGERGLPGVRRRLGPIEAVDPLDAFGTAGPYDRSAVARLFGGRRARVAHGWSWEGAVLTSVTLVSPYPDPTLTTLMPGTLVITYAVENRGL